MSRVRVRRALVPATAGAVLLAVALLAAGGIGVARATGTDSITFGTPTGTAVLDTPLTLSITFQAGSQPSSVQLLSHLPTDTVLSVEAAHLSDAEGTYTATISDPEFILPNTTFDYQFQVALPDRTVALSPVAEITVQDTRFAWQTLQGSDLRLHWYDGDQAFSQHAVDIGDRAIEGAESLLGVKLDRAADAFIYDSEGPFRDALGPGTRENVGGQAVSDINTFFGLIEPADISSDWVRILMTHELTHLVFNTAADNPYHLPPRWLNEGLAVYLSEGDDATEQATLQSAIDGGTVIPLEGLGGLFPTGDGFGVAYAESVSAVSYLVDTYGKESLVKLIRSYARGVTDDEAFTSAIGEDVARFDADWLATLGVSATTPYGPRPAPAGPLPPGWTP